MALLFGMPEPKPAYPERLRAMHKYFGQAEGHTCGTCAHLLVFEMGGRWFKCGLAKHTGSVATDWRARWPACGRWKERAE